MRADEQELREFCRLVARMREAQKTYFASRSGIALAAAKTLEKRVDDFLRQAESNAPRQGSLFLRKIGGRKHVENAAS